MKAKPWSYPLNKKKKNAAALTILLKTLKNPLNKILTRDMPKEVTRNLFHKIRTLYGSPPGKGQQELMDSVRATDYNDSSGLN
jgi:hypothetical protein